MRRFHTLAAKLGIIGGTLLLAAFASIGYTLWASWQLEGGAAAVNEAGRMRMQTWRLAQTLTRSDALTAKAQLSQFDQSVALLRDGDPARPLLVPRDARSSAAFADVQREWQTIRAAWTASPAPAPTLAAQQAQRFVEHIDILVSAIEVRLSNLTTILNLLQVLMVGLTIASAVTLLYSAYLFVFNPLERLRSGLARVREGDLSARIAVESSDEFGALSEGFNRMAETLQELYQNLEVKVEEKTLRLAAQHARLTTLYEASAFAAHASTLEELADGFAKQVRRVAKADASAIRWSDEANLRYLLLASDGLPRNVADREQCIPTGDCHCGQPLARADTRVIPIRVEGEGMPRDCGQAGFTEIVSVPVQLQDRMIGEMDLFYRAPTVLTGEDRTLLETMASHLAVAIEGLRAGALEREAAVAAERSLIAREIHDSIAQSLAFMKIQTGLLRSALKNADAARTQQTVGELEAGIHESLSDVRELLMHFRTRTNAEDIAAALQTTLQKFEHQTGLTTHLSIEGHGVPLPADVQVQVLHVVQEALSNVRKHAQAREVWVDVQQTPQWRVEVRDDGCGFAVEGAAHDETHVGLRIMHERAERIDADVEIASVPGSGTCIVLTLPEPRRLAA
ncbi:type IV pili methyl-accepting chemotaxis transducer N-terminal domain-containing protein [Paraburkholderia phenoliruptrix]|uniref:type IV pili methyl-accepting chemotaxis transducer N-terminal domain-containing protein n=1 Tax=Paraburkholderia phenoliruptrix TaxID=252970 RepID=UPI001C6E2F82|nr:type IV pili methyl-accepting chemotaxis transducer N-terminal domain-containing protein [Paraburkholderia phenoliruptrix]MBW9107129.1 type IV pili methyl-accepting chemotaxis transducer N-terminal domain-containing protein [Paraburkholderia phenoliruptrix]MBW9132150.1 type IV pili methyl-accepting chemotaxis transducer N-terminal domain-containing protein [Paraburkholderia ginsengiterrae]